MVKTDRSHETPHLGKPAQGDIRTKDYFGIALIR
jgi:hypothetical protein